MTSTQQYDCIVIGGGHNGLVAAAYLARAGKSVCVLERRDVLGGCATTENLWPGYQVSTAAYVVSLLLPEIIRDLRLKDYGLNILARTPSSYTPLLDGRSLTMGSDLKATCTEIAKFSQADAEAYPAYQALLERVAAAIEPIFNETAPNPLPLSRSWRKVGWRDRWSSWRTMWQTFQRTKQLEDDLPATIELLTGAARPILERWFESEVLRATLATDAIIGAFSSISSPGTAYVLLHHVMGQAGGARGVWGYIQGGMGGLAKALEQACVDLHVDIVREAEVSRILTEDGKVQGVQLADHRVLMAPAVASSVDAHLTFERFLDPSDLPEAFRQQVARIDYSSASAKINLAVSELPNFCGTATPVLGPEHCGTIHIGSTLNYLERAYEDAARGWPSTEPILEITIPTSVDHTIAPEGKHLISMFVQYAPYQLVDGNWDDIKEDFADRCIELLARYAPNVPGAIEHRQVLSPLDLERTFGLTGGNIMQGAMNLNQLYFMRPVAGWADHRSPVEGLYLCGAASHPGGGVMGACGRNAAQEILRDC